MSRRVITGLLVAEAVAVLLIVYGGIARWGHFIEISSVRAVEKTHRAVRPCERPCYEGAR